MTVQSCWFSSPVYPLLQKWLGCFHPLGVPTDLPVPPFLLAQISKGHIARSDISCFISVLVLKEVCDQKYLGEWPYKFLAKASKETCSTRTITVQYANLGSCILSTLVQGYELGVCSHDVHSWQSHLGTLILIGMLQVSGMPVPVCGFLACMQVSSWPPVAARVLFATH